MLSLCSLLSLSMACQSDAPQEVPADQTSTQAEPKPAGEVEQLQVSSSERGVLEVSWSAADPEPADYWLAWTRAREDYPSASSSEGNAFVAATAFTLSGLEPGVFYKVRVRPRYWQREDPEAIRLGPWTASVRARVIAPPSAPTGLVATATPRGVVLEWDDPQDDSIRAYVIVRELHRTVLRKVFRSESLETSFLDFEAEPDTPYDYTVRSVNSDGPGAESESAYVNTLPPIPGREILYKRMVLPITPSRADWYWEAGRSSMRELEIDFTIHNDVGDWSNQNGYFLILMSGQISGVTFYFGLQTDIDGVKGAVFSRWETRDLSHARFDPTHGWTQSSGHEGDFIGVRRAYDWTAGDYRARIAPEGADSGGEWFGVWLTDLSTDVATWVGSLRFPTIDGSAAMPAQATAAIELYGRSTRPIATPEWHVTVKRPTGDGMPAAWGQTHYEPVDPRSAMPNSDVLLDHSNGAAHFRIGGLTERINPPDSLALE